MSLHAINDKARRAIRNRTGANFSHDQLRELAAAGFLHWVALLEADELCRQIGISPPNKEAVLRFAVRDAERQAAVDDGAAASQP